MSLVPKIHYESEFTMGTLSFKVYLFSLDEC